HRDVKPENILLDSDGRACLMDFGIARFLGESVNVRLTATGITLGTPAYMSPEQGASERTLDGRSDLYSLACVLYEMLSGDPPFSGRSSRAIMARHAHETPYALRVIRPSVPESVEYALQRALAKAPADRFANVGEFIRALGAPPPADWVTPADVARERSVRRRRLLFIAAAALAVSVVTSAVVVARRPSAIHDRPMRYQLAEPTHTVPRTASAP
ncbi:MAG TPA: serine/threonine-protein kinase, partial [Gemmatimonadaceae bacterium]